MGLNVLPNMDTPSLMGTVLLIRHPSASNLPSSLRGRPSR